MLFLRLPPNFTARNSPETLWWRNRQDFFSQLQAGQEFELCRSLVGCRKSSGARKARNEGEYELGKRRTGGTGGDSVRFEPGKAPGKRARDVRPVNEI